jgi:hypothetical protein
MRKSWIIGIGLIVLLIIIQFFHPEKNSSHLDEENDIITFASPPDQIATLLTKACYNCHSNQTVYPWYNHISPVSWYLSRHIMKGKKQLNFSEYGNKDKADRIGLLVKICEELEAGTMPLKSYRIIHKEARLTQEERKMICDWTEEEALNVMRK